MLRVGGLIKRHHINTLIYLGSSLLNRAATILLIPIYTSHLTEGEYGLFGLYQTFFWFVPVVLTFSLSAALARFYFDSTDPRERDGAVGAIARTIIAAALASGLVLEVVLHLLPETAFARLQRGHLELALWTCVAIPIAEIPGVYFRVAEQPVRYALLSTSQFAVTIFTNAYLILHAGWGLAGLLVGALLGNLTGALFGVTFVWRRLRPTWTEGLVRSAIRYSLPFVPHMVATSLMVGVDRWVLEYYGLQSDLGLYTLAVQLTVPISLVGSAWNEASSPRQLAAWRDGGKDAASIAVRRITAGFVASTGATLLAIVAAIPILRHFVGVRFQAAFPLIPWVGLTVVIGFVHFGFVNVLQISKSTRIIPILTGFALVVNAVLNFVLVPPLGVYGAILATGLALAVRAAASFTFALRVLRA